MKLPLVGGALIALLVTAPAMADMAEVDNLGGDVDMFSGPIDILAGAQPMFSEADLMTVHNTLAGNGITTDGFVTFILANTNAGLTFITLVDDNTVTPTGGALDSLLGFSSVGPDTATSFFNDDTEALNVVDLGNGSQITSGMFRWDGDSEGDGHAWGNLGTGDTLTYFIDDLGTPGLTGASPFQFVSFNEGDGSWSVVATEGFSPADQLVFSLETVIPAPGSVALLSLAFMGARTRRRRN